MTTLELVFSRFPPLQECSGSVQPPTDTPEALKTYLIDIGLSALTRGDWSTVQLITICLQGGGLRHA